MPSFVITWGGGARSPTIAQPKASSIDSPILGPRSHLPDLWTTGRWRGDNAAELRNLLHLNADATLETILAQGWRAWQEDLADHLRGPFGICILDARSQTLFAARDTFGVEPMFIARNAGKIALACNPRIARSAVDLSSSPNDAMIAALLRGTVADKRSTFHTGLERLPPGNLVTFDASLKGEPHPYFDLQKVPVAEPATKPINQFRSLLDEAVELYSRGAHSIGLTLSGGLDASAIAGSLAHNHPNHSRVSTFSMTYYDQDGWADGRHIEAMRAALDMDHHSLESSHHDPMTRMPQMLEALDGPCVAYGLSANASLFPLARDLGVDTLLTGDGGDEIVSYGLGRLNELARAGRWRELWRETDGPAELSSMSRWRVLSMYLQHKKYWRKIHAVLSKIPDPKASQHPPYYNDEAVLDRELSAAFPADANALPQPMSNSHHTERDIQEAALLSPVQAHAVEVMTLAGRHFDLNMAYPFYSRKLAEFSLSLPSKWKLQNGQTRYILRESMRGRVPDGIIQRNDKNDFASAFFRGVLKSEAVRDFAYPSNTKLKGHVNEQWLKETWFKMEQSASAVSFGDARAIWRVAVLAQWLDSDRDACLKDNF